MDNFVVRQWKCKILGERVDQAERQLVMVILAMDRIMLEVPERIVHPAHVPLDTEP